MQGSGLYGVQLGCTCFVFFVVIEVLSKFKENSKVTLKTPNARKFFNQNDRWVKKFQREKCGKNLRCGQVTVFKTVKNSEKIRFCF